jgi:acetyl esterase/lipase
LAAAGYGVWSLEYRRSGDTGGGWPGSYDDVKQGIEYTSSLTNYPLDLEHVILMGHSAGGHLALLAATEYQNIDAVIGLAAITNIVDYSRGENSCQTATIDFMGGAYEAKPTAYEAANPISKTLHLNSILLHGNIDPIVPLEQAHATGATAVVVEGTGHFDWIHPGSEAYQVLLSTLENVFGK